MLCSWPFQDIYTWNRKGNEKSLLGIIQVAAIFQESLSQAEQLSASIVQSLAKPVEKACSSTEILESSRNIANHNRQNSSME